MNLLDLLVDDVAPRAASGVLACGQRVRAIDGRSGEVVVYVEATERACVRFAGVGLPEFVHRLELEALPDCPHAWESTQSVWSGETAVRHTRTCTRCGQVRGRE